VRRLFCAVGAIAGISQTWDVDPETKQALRVALERTRMSLGLTDNLADGIIAHQIIEFAKAGSATLNFCVKSH
jgi:hypothetical protein